MKIVLLCNYAPDRQQSMLRFGSLLAEAWSGQGDEVRIAAPEPSLLGALRLRTAQHGLGKWIAYADKYLVFPRRIPRIVAELRGKRALVHVVDHSNALYLPRRSATPWVSTCHDLLAVRGALGEDTDCPASALGRKLQAAIVRGLGRAAGIAADSNSTMGDVERLVPANRRQKRRTILLGLNHPYRQIDVAVALRRLESAPGVPWAHPFLIHVGSNLARKNKPGIVRVFGQIAAKWSGNLVFCGAPLPAEVRTQVAALGLSDRVFAAPTLDNSSLEAAYNCAHALLYPSRCEGFGWPVIEAQACGCPVICSDRTSLPEVGGDAALVHPLADEKGMAESVLMLTQQSHRNAIVQRGLANVRRFAVDRMIDDYRALYEEVLADSE